MAIIYQPAVMQKSNEMLQEATDNALFNMYKSSDFGPEAIDHYNAFINAIHAPKQCLSCGARTNSNGQLPCGH